MRRALTSSELNQICNADVVLGGLGTQGIADANHLGVLPAVAALVRQDDGPVAGPRETVVEGEADGGTSVVGACTIGADEGRLQVRGNLSPYCWALGRR